MNRSTLSTLSYISESVKDRDMIFWHNGEPSLKKIVLLKFVMDIFDSLDIMRFLYSYKLSTRWEISNSDGFIRKISFRSIQVDPISNWKNIYIN